MCRLESDKKIMLNKRGKMKKEEERKIMNNKNLTIDDVLNIICKEHIKADTEYSKQIFNMEEGKKDEETKKNNKNNKKKTGRRDWLVLSDIYNKKNYTQKFHLENYLRFKLCNGYNGNDNFYNKCYRYLRNAALILYINEIIFKEDKESLEGKFNMVKEHFDNESEINNVKLANSIKLI